MVDPLLDAIRSRVSLLFQLVCPGSSNTLLQAWAQRPDGRGGWTRLGSLLVGEDDEPLIAFSKRAVSEETLTARAFKGMVSVVVCELLRCSNAHLRQRPVWCPDLSTALSAEDERGGSAGLGAAIALPLRLPARGSAPAEVFVVELVAKDASLLVSDILLRILWAGASQLNREQILHVSRLESPPSAQLSRRG